MATRHALRLVHHRFSSSGKVAENVFAKGSHLKSPTMAARHALRLVPCRFSFGGKVLSGEEKFAENEFIKKMDSENLEKLARKQAEFNELAQQMEALKKENASLRVEALKEENKSLRAEVGRIRSKYEKLHAKDEDKDLIEAFVIGFIGSTFGLIMASYLVN